MGRKVRVRDCDGLTKDTGNLMLAIQARSFNNYFYLQNGNVNHPAKYIGNKVSGILFENKVDYASTSKHHQDRTIDPQRLNVGK